MVKRFSRVAKRTVKGVKAYARIPTRSDHQPRGVRVLDVLGLSLCHRFQMMPVNLQVLLEL